MYKYLFLLYFLFYTCKAISDFRRCRDFHCSEIISQAKALSRQQSNDKYSLNFEEGDIIEVYSKEAGRDENLWGGKVNGRFGYFPRDTVEEIDVVAGDPAFIVPTEIYTGIYSEDDQVDETEALSDSDSKENYRDEKKEANLPEDNLAGENLNVGDKTLSKDEPSSADEKETQPPAPNENDGIAKTREELRNEAIAKLRNNFLQRRLSQIKTRDDAVTETDKSKTTVDEPVEKEKAQDDDDTTKQPEDPLLQTATEDRQESVEQETTKSSTEETFSEDEIWTVLDKQASDEAGDFLTTTEDKEASDGDKTLIKTPEDTEKIVAEDGASMAQDEQTLTGDESLPISVKDSPSSEGSLSSTRDDNLPTGDEQAPAKGNTDHHTFDKTSTGKVKDFTEDLGRKTEKKDGANNVPQYNQARGNAFRSRLQGQQQPSHLPAENIDETSIKDEENVGESLAGQPETDRPGAGSTDEEVHKEPSAGVNHDSGQIEPTDSLLSQPVVTTDSPLVESQIQEEDIVEEDVHEPEPLVEDSQPDVATEMEDPELSGNEILDDSLNEKLENFENETDSLAQNSAQEAASESIISDALNSQNESSSHGSETEDTKFQQSAHVSSPDENIIQETENEEPIMIKRKKVQEEILDDEDEDEEDFLSFKRHIEKAAVGQKQRLGDKFQKDGSQGEEQAQGDSNIQAEKKPAYGDFQMKTDTPGKDETVQDQMPRDDVRTEDETPGQAHVGGEKAIDSADEKAKEADVHYQQAGGGPGGANELQQAVETVLEDNSQLFDEATGDQAGTKVDGNQAGTKVDGNEVDTKVDKNQVDTNKVGEDKLKTDDEKVAEKGSADSDFLTDLFGDDEEEIQTGDDKTSDEASTPPDENTAPSDASDIQTDENPSSADEIHTEQKDYVPEDVTNETAEGGNDITSESDDPRATEEQEPANTNQQLMDDIPEHDSSPQPDGGDEDTPPVDTDSIGEPDQEFLDENKTPGEEEESFFGSMTSWLFGSAEGSTAGEDSKNVLEDNGFCTSDGECFDIEGKPLGETGSDLNDVTTVLPDYEEEIPPPQASEEDFQPDAPEEGHDMPTEAPEVHDIFADELEVPDIITDAPEEKEPAAMVTPTVTDNLQEDEGIHTDIDEQQQVLLSQENDTRLKYWVRGNIQLWKKELTDFYVPMAFNATMDVFESGVSYFKMYTDYVLGSCYDPPMTALLELLPFSAHWWTYYDFWDLSPPRAVLHYIVLIVAMMLVFKHILKHKSVDKKVKKAKPSVLELEAQLQHSQQLNDALYSELQTAKGKVKENPATTKELKQLKKELQEAKLQNERLQSSVKQATSDKSSTELEVEQLKNDLQTTNAELENLKSQLEQEKTEKEAAEAALQQKQDNDAQQLSEIEVQQEEITKMKKKVIQLEKQLSEAQTMLTTSQEEAVDLQAKLHSVGEETVLLEQSKAQLLVESRAWDDKVKEQEAEIDSLHEKINEAKGETALKEQEIEILKDCLRQLKGEKKDENKAENEDDEEDETEAKEQKEEDWVNQIIDVAQMKAKVTELEAERKMFQEMADQERAAQRALQEETDGLREQVAELEKRHQEAVERTKESEMKLSVLTGYFKEKEAELQKQTAAILNKEEQTASENVGQLQKLHAVSKELESKKKQISEMHKECSDLQESFSKQIRTQELQTHENWIAASKRKRELEEAKNENTILRQKLQEMSMRTKDLERQLAASQENNAIVKPVPTHPGDVSPPRFQSPPPPGRELHPSMRPLEDLRPPSFEHRPRPPGLMYPPPLGNNGDMPHRDSPHARNFTPTSMTEGEPFRSEPGRWLPPRGPPPPGMRPLPPRPRAFRPPMEGPPMRGYPPPRLPMDMPPRMYTPGPPMDPSFRDYLPPPGNPRDGPPRDFPPRDGPPRDFPTRDGPPRDFAPRPPMDYPRDDFSGPHHSPRGDPPGGPVPRYSPDEPKPYYNPQDGMYPPPPEATEQGLPRQGPPPSRDPYP